MAVSHTPAESLEGLIRWAKRAAIVLAVGAGVSFVAQGFILARTVPQLRHTGGPGLVVWLLLAGLIVGRAVTAWRAAAAFEEVGSAPASLCSAFLQVARAFRLHAALLALIAMQLLGVGAGRF